MKELKYNPMNDEWEMVPRDWVLHYVPALGRWKYGPPDANASAYNTVEDTFSPRRRGAKPVYNAPEEHFELGEDDYVEIYNPITGKFELRPKEDE